MTELYMDKLRSFIDEIDHYRGKQKSLWEFDEDRTRVKLYTNGHVYAISASPTYLGCIASTRKPRPGETWTRGNDLADGSFGKEIWDRILRDIVGYELMTISSYVLNKEGEAKSVVLSSGDYEEEKTQELIDEA